MNIEKIVKSDINFSLTQEFFYANLVLSQRIMKHNLETKVILANGHLTLFERKNV